METYNIIAEEFDKTRTSQWNCVRQFLNTLPSFSLVADVGCGNGKYFNYRKDLVVIGNDASTNLVEIANKRQNAYVTISNGLHLPYRSEGFDACICVAVLHHIYTAELRIQFIQQLVRILKPGATCFIVVWALEQHIKPKWRKTEGDGNYLVPWGDKADRWYHLFNKKEVDELFGSLTGIVIDSISWEMDNWCITFTKLKSFKEENNIVIYNEAS